MAGGWRPLRGGDRTGRGWAGAQEGRLQCPGPAPFPPPRAKTCSAAERRHLLRREGRGRGGGEKPPVEPLSLGGVGKAKARAALATKAAAIAPRGGGGQPGTRLGAPDPAENFSRTPRGGQAGLLGRKSPLQAAPRWEAFPRARPAATRSSTFRGQRERKSPRRPPPRGGKKSAAGPDPDPRHGRLPEAPSPPAGVPRETPTVRESGPPAFLVDLCKSSTAPPPSKRDPRSPRGRPPADPSPRGQLRRDPGGL